MSAQNRIVVLEIATSFEPQYCSHRQLSRLFSYGIIGVRLVTPSGWQLAFS
jgi:hypothetical protein